MRVKIVCLLFVICCNIYSMDYIYKVNAGATIGTDRDLFEPIQQKDVNKFILLLEKNGFNIDLYFLDEKYFLYTKDYNLAKYINHNISLNSITQSGILKGNEFTHDGQVYRYYTYDNKYLNINDYKSYKSALDKKYIKGIDNDRLSKFSQLTIDDIQNNYIEGYALSNEYYEMNFNREFIYHLLDLGFPIDTDSESGTLIIPRFKFYIK